jgi:hypothetical protein
MIKEGGFDGKRSTHGGDDNEYTILVGKPKGKRSLGRPRHRCTDIKIYIKKISLKGRDHSEDLGIDVMILKYILNR